MDKKVRISKITDGCLDVFRGIVEEIKQTEGEFLELNGGLKTKKTTSFRLEAETSIKLKVWAAEHQMAIGDVIQKMVEYFEKNQGERKLIFQQENKIK